MNTLPASIPDNEEIDMLAAGWVLGDLSFEEEERWNSIPVAIREEIVSRTEIAASKILLTFHEAAAPTEAALPEVVRSAIRDACVPNSDAKSNSSVVSDHTTVSTQISSVTWREQASWILAIAACITALCAWLPFLTESFPRGGKLTIVDADRPVPIEDRRNRLLTETSGTILADWQTPTGPGPDSSLGNIVWNSATQSGFMTISSLPKNDPTKEQYQLWIIDPERDSKPVDGGVFDIVGDSPSIIPFQAKLRVGKPTLFAITVEKPGGVVVSDQSRLPLLAKVSDR